MIPDSTTGDDSSGDVPAAYNDIDEPCYQQKESKVLHLPGSAKDTLKCGRRIIAGYTFLPGGASFKWARCSLCFKGQVITTTDELVDVMGAIRSRRFQS